MARRPNLLQVMAAVLVLAVGLAMMKVAANWLAQAVIFGAAVALLVATLGAIVRRRHRAAWIGAAVFGWGYASLAAGVPAVAEIANNQTLFENWRLDVAFAPLVDRLHPELPSPTDPFPDNAVDTDPATGRRTIKVGGGFVLMTPEQSKLQLAYEARTAFYEARLRSGRNARAIGLSIQGLAFVLIGGFAGQVLSDRPAEGGSPAAVESSASPD